MHASVRVRVEPARVGRELARPVCSWRGQIVSRVEGAAGSERVVAGGQLSSLVVVRERLIPLQREWVVASKASVRPPADPRCLRCAIVSDGRATVARMRVICSAPPGCVSQFTKWAPWTESVDGELGHQRLHHWRVTGPAHVGTSRRPLPSTSRWVVDRSPLQRSNGDPATPRADSCNSTQSSAWSLTRRPTGPSTRGSVVPCREAARWTVESTSVPVDPARGVGIGPEAGIDLVPGPVGAEPLMPLPHSGPNAAASRSRQAIQARSR
jgi:hypothetical protein